MLQAFLDHHEGEGRRQSNAQRARAVETWAEMGQTPEQRLLKFDVWVLQQLDRRLQWPADPVRKVKLQGQCRAELERLVLELWRRGWMLDGAKLAEHIADALDQVGRRQREGKVSDFWPFFRHVVTTYVGANAEEIQAEARRTPTVGALLANMGVTKAIGRAPSMPELIAQRRDETLRERATKARRVAAQAESEADQMRLL